jgi:hypothetical protein
LSIFSWALTVTANASVNATAVKHLVVVILLST